MPTDEPAPSSQIPSVLGGKYLPTRLIARGGMGAVYEVVHANTGEHLALKVMLARSLLAPELVARFKREARIQSSVKSEHVVRVIDADVAPELDGAPFLVMELLTGQDLERLSQERRPTPEEVVGWLGQAGRALDRAHSEGIIHRDLKPENLFLARREEQPPVVKILDFGVAKMSSSTEGNSTATGQILGTPRYMAPEQAAGAKEVTAAADRCALGLIAFRLLAGRHYFDGANWVALLREVTRGSTTAPSEMGCDLGPAFDAWFGKACAFEPRQRFSSCAEQIDALGKALASVAVLPSWRRAVWRARRVIRWTAVVAACAAVVLPWALRRGTDRHRASSAEPSAAPVRPPAPAVEPPEHEPPKESLPPATRGVSPDRPRKRRPVKRPAENVLENVPGKNAIWDDP